MEMMLLLLLVEEEEEEPRSIRLMLPSGAGEETVEEQKKTRVLISIFYYGPGDENGGLKQLFNWGDIVECAPISLVFACGNALNLMQYKFGVPSSV